MQWGIRSLVCLTVLGGSFIQSVTGFGFGIFSMIFLTNLLAYSEANVLSTMLGMGTSAIVVLSSFRSVHWRNLIFPLLGSLPTTWLAVSFIRTQKNDTLMLLLGAVLVLLSLYFFFFSGRIKIRPTWYAGLTAGLISGLMSGMFSIGGPPVVVYFLQSERDSRVYLSTISCYFVCTGVGSVSAKAAAGFVTSEVWICFFLGVAALSVGALLGKRLRSHIRPHLLRRVIYGFMGASGIVNILNVIL